MSSVQSNWTHLALVLIVATILSPTQILGNEMCSCASDADGGCIPNQVCDPGGNCNKVNVAYGKHASMSSMSYGHILPACAAVNGRTSHTLSTTTDRNCVHTVFHENNSFWQVDLGQDFTITAVTVYSRTDQVKRLAGMDILVDSQTCRRLPDSEAGLGGEQIYGLTSTIPCNSLVTGRIVQFYKYKTYESTDLRIIDFCEVQIWECIDGYHGGECTERCGQCKDNAACDRNTGHCPGGCKAGYRPPDCKTECTDGFYGAGCADKCGQCKNTTMTCDKTTGHCPGEVCETGYQSPSCNQKTPKGPDSAVIGGASAAGLVAVVVVAVVAVVLRRRCSSSEVRKSVTDHQLTNVVEDPGIYRSTGAPDNHDYAVPDSGLAQPDNAGNVYTTLKATKPHLDALQTYLVDRLASMDLPAEFRAISTIDGSLSTDHPDAGKMTINKNNILYPVIIPYDQSGVILRYVNASYTKGHEMQGGPKYVASQGPKDTTVADFWCLVWQEKITRIVMLANAKEKGQKMCRQYWPDEEGGSMTWGPVTVTTTGVDLRGFFCIRTFSVKRDKVSREVTQYCYASWPDHGFPAPTSLVRFWRDVCSRTRDDRAPLLVHSSAGVGRTGTYVGLDIGMKTAVNNGKVNVLDLVKGMRKERTLMVQTVEQYGFLHEALLEAYTARDTLLTTDQFDDIFPNTVSANTPNPRIDAEFKTFRDPKGSILTQRPLPSTLVDFWRLVYGNDVTTIVSLCSPGEEKEVTPYCHYYPRGMTEPMATGPYTVSLTSKTTDRSSLSSYTLQVQKTGESSPRSVRVLHYEGWTGEEGGNCAGEEGGNCADMLTLLDAALSSSADGESPPLLVQCSDGVSKSGLFSALCDIINHMTYDRQCDVYMAVRHVQTVSPNAVTSLAQYRYCYQIAQQRHRDTGVYANT